MVLFSLVAGQLHAQDSEIISVDLASGDSVDIRQFSAQGDNGDKLLLGFACDEGTGTAEMNTAAMMADGDIEIWMPDLLSAHFLPKLKSSLVEIPSSDIVDLIDLAVAQADKAVYLIASGTGSALLLRGLHAWEQQNPEQLTQLKGVILLYPRLNASAPEPGKDPVYIDAVGKTKTPIAILEGSKTPNSWALSGLKEQLEVGGSVVTTSLIPGVRGFFYERDKPNLPEGVVTDQLAGLVRASMVKLDMATVN